MWKAGLGRPWFLNLAVESHLDRAYRVDVRDAPYQVVGDLVVRLDLDETVVKAAVKDAVDVVG